MSFFVACGETSAWCTFWFKNTSFDCHQIFCSPDLVKKNQFFKNIFSIASKLWHLIDGYFHDFLRYDNDSWCKRKLNIHTLRCKSFFTPLTSFLPPILCVKFIENWIWTFKYSMFKPKKGGKKLVEGGKKLFHFVEQHLSFHLHQELMPYLKNSWN